jgi:serine/threonine-protein kinase
MIGKTVSHYKILEKLGGGGMGVVYKAEDTKLNRTVALKFLPTNKLGTEEEKQRFEQEAKAAAQLNHTNIATIYEINEHEGETFIAMEYIEGETISDKVKTRPLKIKDAIKIAKQIAEGLHSAHEQGIVHRDIKSANVMLAKKGVVKIMDFGLAKMSKASVMTKAGTTLGTIYYMSPEQTKGEKVDHRSDIWSLGVVLYEMISGQLPFKGDYDQAVTYSILNEEPDPLTAVRTGVPMDLEKIVNKLLAKDPDERYQNIIELPVDLKNVSVQETQTSKIGSSVITDTIRREKELNVKVKYSYKTILTIAATALLTFLLTWIFKPGSPPSKPKPANKMVVSLPEDISFYFSGFNRMAISPDGTNMVYIGRGAGAGIRLFSKRAGSFETNELAETNEARGPFFSPDGRWIGYFNWATREINKVLVNGGQPLVITSFKDDRSGATWAPDNTIIVPYDGVLKRIPESGGEPSVLTKAKRTGERHQFPHMLPDGQTVLFTLRHEGAGLNTCRLAVYRIGDDDYKVILDEEGYNAVYSTTGHILYGRSDRLMGVPFDLKNLRISGVPAPVLDNVQTHNRTGSMSYALSKEGTIIYVPGLGADDDLRSVLNVDLSGKPTEFFDLKKVFESARYSPNGTYVAFSIEEDDADNLWIYQMDGGAINQLTFYKEASIRLFAWSPDSKSLAYATTAEDSTNSIFVKRIDGTGTAQKIYTSPDGDDLRVVDWSGDGNEISFHQTISGSNRDIFVYSFQDSSAKPFLATPAFEGEPYFSSNGKWVLYVSNESGNMEIYVRPYPESSGGVWKISNGGQNPVWSPDGKKIFYRRGNELYSVDVIATDVFSKGNPKKIFEGYYFFPSSRNFDIHPDGKSFIMIQTSVGSQEQKIFVIQNFDEELKRLLPVGRN